MSEPTCATCRHWSMPNWQPSGFGTCVLAAPLKSDTPQIIKVVGAKGAWLATHKSFGCNQHEAEKSR